MRAVVSVVAVVLAALLFTALGFAVGMSKDVPNTSVGTAACPQLTETDFDILMKGMRLLPDDMYDVCEISAEAAKHPHCQAIQEQYDYMAAALPVIQTLYDRNMVDTK